MTVDLYQIKKEVFDVYQLYRNASFMTASLRDKYDRLYQSPSREEFIKGMYNFMMQMYTDPALVAFKVFAQQLFQVYSKYEPDLETKIQQLMSQTVSSEPSATTETVKKVVEKTPTIFEKQPAEEQKQDVNDMPPSESKPVDEPKAVVATESTQTTEPVKTPTVVKPEVRKVQKAQIRDIDPDDVVDIRVSVHKNLFQDTLLVELRYVAVSFLLYGGSVRVDAEDVPLLTAELHSRENEALVVTLLKKYNLNITNALAVQLLMLQALNHLNKTVIRDIVTAVLKKQELVDLYYYYVQLDEVGLSTQANVLNLVQKIGRMEKHLQNVAVMNMYLLLDRANVNASLDPTVLKERIGTSAIMNQYDDAFLALDKVIDSRVLSLKEKKK